MAVKTLDLSPEAGWVRRTGGVGNLEGAARGGEEATAGDQGGKDEMQ